MHIHDCIFIIVHTQTVHMHTQSDMFQDDIFPPTFAGKPAITADDWISGKDSDPLLTSFTPNGLSELSAKESQVVSYDSLLLSSARKLFISLSLSLSLFLSLSLSLFPPPPLSNSFLFLSPFLHTQSHGVTFAAQGGAGGASQKKQESKVVQAWRAGSPGADGTPFSERPTPVSLDEVSHTHTNLY